MKGIVAALVIVLFLGLSFSCADMSGTQKGALIGGSAGGILGAFIGKDKPLLGAAIGAATGALAGAVIGHYVEQKQRSAQETARAYQYQPVQGTVVKVEDVRMEPDAIKPGQSSKLVIKYALMNSDPNEPIPVKETREIWAQDKPLKAIGPVNKSRSAGTYATEQEVTFPKNLPEATYTLKGSVEAKGVSSSKETAFQVVRREGASGVTYAFQRVER